MDSCSAHTTLSALARFIGIFAPTLYCGITAQCFTASDSLTFVEPIVNHAPNQKVMAKQWLHGYQYGPSWVPPLIAPGTLSNLHLAYLCSNTPQRNCYLAAALGIFSILPITFFYMEPGINGASKWKVQSLRQEEDSKYRMSETSIYLPSSRKHGSTQASRKWAEESDMKDLIKFWQSVNNVRWVIGGAAAMLSGYATFGMQTA